MSELNCGSREARTFSFKCATHSRDRELCGMNDFHVMKEKSSFLRKIVRLFALITLPDHRDRRYYEDSTKNGKCLTIFPYFILFVTVIEFSFFVYYNVVSNASQVPIDSIFIYRPDKKEEIWRFFLYMLLHASWIHITFNLIMQFLVGIPLEMVHGSTRIACIYMAGILAGSLGTSILDPGVFLVGSSGGVYALLTAHLANIMLNYNNMNYGIVRFLGILIFASCDVGFAIYSRYEGNNPAVAYTAHLTGALAGLTIGLVVLKNFEQKLHEQLLWWVALGIYLACVIFAIIFNIINSVNLIKLREENEVELFHKNQNNY